MSKPAQNQHQQVLASLDRSMLSLRAGAVAVLSLPFHPPCCHVLVPAVPFPTTSGITMKSGE
eukprot:3798561-Pleurochrysis_carterae.AAC.3